MVVTWHVCNHSVHKLVHKASVSQPRFVDLQGPFVRLQRVRKLLCDSIDTNFTGLFVKL